MRSGCSSNRQKGTDIREKQYFAGLDGLKGIFCIGIVIYHVGGLFNYTFSDLLGPVYAYGGYFGNYMFFIISGFLLAYGNRKETKEESGTFIGFMAKHLAKSYPIYFLSSLVMLIVGNAPFTAERMVVTVLMGHGWLSGETMPYNFPTWFLCILFICYGLYYGIAAISRKYPKLYVPLCGVFIIWGMALEVCDWNVPLSYRTCGEGYMNFFLGAMLAEVLSIKKADAGHIKIMNYIMLLTAAAAIYLRGFDHLPGDMRWWVSFLCINLASLSVHEGLAAKILSCPILHMAGMCSRDIFLWHIPVVWTFLRFAPRCSAEGTFLVYLLVLAFFAAFLYFGRKVVRSGLRSGEKGRSGSGKDK